MNRKHLNRTELVNALASIGRHDRLPSRDVFMALDQIERDRTTLDSIKETLDRLERSPLASRQAF